MSDPISSSFGRQRVAETASADTTDLVRSLSVLWRWKKAIVLGSVGAAAIALLASLTMSKVYESKAVLMVASPRFRQQTVSGSYDQEEVRMAKSYEGVVKSQGTLIAALKEFKLEDEPFNLTLAKFDKHVTVEAVKDSNVIEVTVELTDRLLAADVANYIARQAVDTKRRVSDASLERSRVFMQAEVARAGAEKEASENALKKLRTENASDILKQQTEVRLDRLQVLEKRLSTIDVELAKVTGERESLEKEMGKLSKTITTTRGLIDDAIYQQVVARRIRADPASLVGLKMEYEQLNPTYTAVEGELAVRRTSEAGYVAERPVVSRLLEQNLKELADLRKGMFEKELKTERLKGVLDLASDNLTKLSMAMNATNVEVVSKSADLEVVDPAHPSEEPERPRKLINTVVGGAFGFLLMVTIAFFAEFIERSGGLERLTREAA